MHPITPEHPAPGGTHASKAHRRVPTWSLVRDCSTMQSPEVLSKSRIIYDRPSEVISEERKILAVPARRERA